MQKDDLKQYLEAIYNRCYRILRDPDQAWDALQDVFEAYYQHRKKEEIQIPLAYLYRMSTNHCINMLRRDKRLLPLIEEWHQGKVEEGHIAENRLMIDSLTQQFGVDAIAFLVYRHVDQMTYQEIGEIVGMSDRGVKKKLERTERQIRDHFQQEQE